MRLRALAAVLAGLSVLVLQPGTDSAKGQGPPTMERYIVIGKDSAGDCTVLATPTLIRGARPGTRVVWRVNNECDTQRTVSVDNFKHRQDSDRRKEPLDLDAVGPIGPGASGQISGRIKPQPDGGTYKYDIKIDGTVKDDPEIEIQR